MKRSIATAAVLLSAGVASFVLANRKAEEDIREAPKGDFVATAPSGDAGSCPSPPIPDGHYFIVLASNSSFCIDTPATEGDGRGDLLKVQKMFCNASDTEKFYFGRRDARNCMSIQAARWQGAPGAKYLFVYERAIAGASNITVGKSVNPVPFPTSPSVWRWYVEPVPERTGRYHICSSDHSTFGAAKRCLTTSGGAGDAGTYINVEPLRSAAEQEWVLQAIR